MFKAIASSVIQNFKLRKLTVLPLLYHVVAKENYQNSIHKNLHYVPLQVFQHNIKKLSKRYDFVDAETFFTLTGKDSGRYACLTFDDGYTEAWNTAIPWLEDLGIPSVFYVNSSLVEGGRFWRDDIRQIIDQGMTEEFTECYGLKKHFAAEELYRGSKSPENGLNSLELKAMVDDFFIKKGVVGKNSQFCGLADLKKVDDYQYVKLGNHTSHHFVMSTLSVEEQKNEVAECDHFLRSNFSSNQISNIFSMPFGGKDTYTSDTIAVLKNNNYKGAFVSASNLDELKQLNSPYPDFKVYGRFLPKHYLRIF